MPMNGQGYSDPVAALGRRRRKKTADPVARAGRRRRKRKNAQPQDEDILMVMRQAVARIGAAG